VLFSAVPLECPAEIRFAPVSGGPLVRAAAECVDNHHDAGKFWFSRPRPYFTQERARKPMRSSRVGLEKRGRVMLVL